jgi:putative FmdB family regulatory protein
MPVYEYECKACGRDFEYQQRMSDPDKTTCEACGGALERLISRTAFSLKGGGWYKDLYASPKPPEAKTDAKPEGGKSEGAGKSEGGKSDAPAASADKPAAKPDGGGGTSSSGGSSSSSGGGGSGGSGGSSSAAASPAKAD